LLKTLRARLLPNCLFSRNTTTHKEIAAHYEGGMEGNVIAVGPCYWQRMGIRFLADDPFWYLPGGSGMGGAGSATLLDSNDSATFRMVGARLKDTGQWDNMGPPDVLGTYNDIQTLAEDDVYIYIGGDFTNWNNLGGNADYIIRYNKDTGAYSALGTGMNAAVNALAIGPDGTLYAGGNFTIAGGIAANYIASWNGVAWAALGAGMNQIIWALEIGHDGLLYAGGQFTTAGGIGANYIASWNGAAWAALGVGTDNFVYALAIAPNGDLYVGGTFLNSIRISSLTALRSAVVSMTVGVIITMVSLRSVALVVLPNSRPIPGMRFR